MVDWLREASSLDDGGCWKLGLGKVVARLREGGSQIEER